MRGHLFIGLLALCPAFAAQADEARIAVAANFVHTFERLRTAFEQSAPHRIQIISASTGKLYAQITHGAPFDALLSADAETAARLAVSGEGLADSRFTYAHGRLVLWSATPERVRNGADALRLGVRHVALANPRHAPYGRAAEQALRALQLWDVVEKSLVYGENVNQAMQYAASENAQLAFVALSQVLALPVSRRGGFWEVPRTLYEPIVQDAILLTQGRNNVAAKAFLVFLRSDAAREIIKTAGYE